MNQAGDIIQGTYGDASVMEALPADTPMLDESDLFTC
jgi:hypothetical protein